MNTTTQHLVIGSTGKRENRLRPERGLVREISMSPKDLSGETSGLFVLVVDVHKANGSNYLLATKEANIRRVTLTHSPFDADGNAVL